MKFNRQRRRVHTTSTQAPLNLHAPCEQVRRHQLTLRSGLAPSNGWLGAAQVAWQDLMAAASLLPCSDGREHCAQSTRCAANVLQRNVRFLFGQRRPQLSSTRNASGRAQLAGHAHSLEASPNSFDGEAIVFTALIDFDCNKYQVYWNLQQSMQPANRTHASCALVRQDVSSSSS